MGDRVSIQFENRGEKSVVLFSHWGGMGFVKAAQIYAIKLRRRNQKSRCNYPLDRREPETVMVDFIRHMTKDMKEVTGDLYLGATECDGDNCDNGHYIIPLGLDDD